MNIFIQTDLKIKKKVGCAAAKYDDCEKMRIPDGSSVFTAEAKAIDLALDFVNNCTYTDKFVIFSDSLSVLQALNHTSSKNSQIKQLLLKHHEISSSKTIIYCWIPSHIGIYGYEKADKNAKESLNLDQTVFLKYLLTILNLLSTNTSLTNGKVHGTKPVSTSLKKSNR